MKDDITIGEVRRLREEAESKIMAILDELMDKSGCPITEIDYNPLIGRLSGILRITLSIGYTIPNREE